MYASTSTLRALGLLLAFSTSVAIAAPTSEQIVEERHVVVVEKRQADVSQLLELASLAGISALPTDPAVLLSLGPLANSLAAALPTPSVLSVLVTAAPPSFVSNIINDPAYANSFESAFSDGSSPSWFTALPTDVRSYLHTYSGFGQLAGGVAGVESGISGSATAAGNSSSAGATAGSGSGTGSGASVTGSKTGSAASGASGSSRGASSSSSSGAGSTATVTSSSSGTASAAAGGASSASSHAGAAAGPTGALAAGIVGVVGILGAAVVL